ncbi:MAG: GNAT family N-acetyltransferase [Solobacterium sp.]|nr:GNAT family N-acetyltransferase [Solobacterium sp.]
MSIRRAENRDIGRLIDLLHQVLEVHASGRGDLFQSGNTKYSETELSSMITDENTPIFVLEDETGTVQGYAMCQIEDLNNSNMVKHRNFYIDDICVDEACRRKHYGNRLYAFAKEYARSIGAYHITLSVWNCNPGAEAFYESLGMKPMKTVMEEIL